MLSYDSITTMQQSSKYQPRQAGTSADILASPLTSARMATPEPLMDEAAWQQVLETLGAGLLLDSNDTDILVPFNDLPSSPVGLGIYDNEQDTHAHIDYLASAMEELAYRADTLRLTDLAYHLIDALSSSQNDATTASLSLETSAVILAHLDLHHTQASMTASEHSRITQRTLLELSALDLMSTVALDATGGSSGSGAGSERAYSAGAGSGGQIRADAVVTPPGSDLLTAASWQHSFEEMTPSPYDTAQDPFDADILPQPLSPPEASCATTMVTTSRNSRRNHPPATRQLLMRWLLDHRDDPYPSIAEKAALRHATGLNDTQLNDWLVNNRKRVLRRSGIEIRKNTVPPGPGSLSKGRKRVATEGRRRRL